jgi:hypothetical protein
MSLLFGESGVVTAKSGLPSRLLERSDHGAYGDGRGRISQALVMNELDRTAENVGPAAGPRTKS